MLNETNLSRLDLNLLVLFEVMSQELHVARTARRMSISASAVSHGLERLRRTLNDPLFIKHPRGMAASDRAIELAQPVKEILDSVRRVVASSLPFDAASSHRKFRIGTADGFSGLLAPLMQHLAGAGPNIDVALGHLRRETALADLDGRGFDLLIAPFENLPPRFASLPLYDEQFVVTMSKGHPYAAQPTMESYCAQRHLLVAPNGDLHGPLDKMLLAMGMRRRVVLAVPNFFLALDMLANTDLIAVMPKSFIDANARHFSVEWTPTPFPQPIFTVFAVAPASAMKDPGMRWLFDQLKAVAAQLGGGDALAEAARATPSRRRKKNERNS